VIRSKSIESVRTTKGVEQASCTGGLYTPRGKGVDDALIQYARDRKATIVTLDSNLAKIARLHNTDVINFSEVFLALRPNINVGDELTIKIVKEGKIRQQGVGFLDDGTMVVVEDAADLIGSTVRVVVTNVHVSDTGKSYLPRLLTKS